jgi:hypothetical protein
MAPIPRALSASASSTADASPSQWAAGRARRSRTAPRGRAAGDLLRRPPGGRPRAAGQRRGTVPRDHAAPRPAAPAPSMRTTSGSPGRRRRPALLDAHVALEGVVPQHAADRGRVEPAQRQPPRPRAPRRTATRADRPDRAATDLRERARARGRWSGPAPGGLERRPRAQRRRQRQVHAPLERRMLSTVQSAAYSPPAT